MNRWTLPLTPLLIAALTSACAPTAAQTAAEAAQAQTDQQALAKQLTGLVAEKPVSCLQNYQTRQTSAYGPAIVYTVSRSLKYVNATTGGCEAVARGDILVTVSPTGQLCQGDIAHTVDQTSHFMTGSCALGPFTPYRKP